MLTLVPSHSAAPIFSTVTPSPSIVDCINHRCDCDGGVYRVLPVLYYAFALRYALYRVEPCAPPCRISPTNIFFSSALFRVCVPDDFLCCVYPRLHSLCLPLFFTSLLLSLSICFVLIGEVVVFAAP